MAFVCLRLKEYGGADPKKRTKYRRQMELKRRIESFLENEVEPGATEIFAYYEIACEMGVTTREVYDVCFRTSGGSNGITVHRPVNRDS